MESRGIEPWLTQGWPTITDLLRFGGEGRFSLSHLPHSGSERPDVNLQCVVWWAKMKKGYMRTSLKSVIYKPPNLRRLYYPTTLELRCITLGSCGDLPASIAPLPPLTALGNPL